MASPTLAKQHRSTEKVLAYLAKALRMPAERARESFRIARPADIRKILELRRDTLGNVLRWASCNTPAPAPKPGEACLTV